MIYTLFLGIFKHLSTSLVDALLSHGDEFVEKRRLAPQPGGRRLERQVRSVVCLIGSVDN